MSVAHYTANSLFLLNILVKKYVFSMKWTNFEINYLYYKFGL